MTERNYHQRLQDLFSIKQETYQDKNTDDNTCQVASEADIESCIVGDELTIGCGKRIPIISACIKPAMGSKDNMPVATRRVRERLVNVLRDTGCSEVIINRDLVTEEDLTGRFCCMLLIYNTIRKVPIARVFIDTPYYIGEVDIQCLSDVIYDVIMGNISNARWVSSLAVRVLAFCAKDCGLGPTYSQWLDARSLSTQQ